MFANKYVRFTELLIPSHPGYANVYVMSFKMKLENLNKKIFMDVVDLLDP